MANYQPCGAVLNIVSSKAAILLAWLTKPMVQYHLQKLNQAGKATHSLVPLPVTMTLNYSELLASSILPLTTNPSLNIQLKKCKRDLLTQKERRHAEFAVGKDEMHC